MNLSFKSILQLILGLIFVSIGIYIFVKNFEQGSMISNQNKYIFGGILCIYGLIKFVKIYISDIKK